MNTKTYKRLIWLVIILLILNISTLGTIAYFRFFSPNYPASYQPRIGCKDSHKMHDVYFREKVGYTTAQMDQFRKIRDQHYEEIQDIRTVIGKNRQFFFKELEQENPNLKIIDSLNRNVGDLHYKWAGSSTNFLTEAGNICTKEQRTEFYQLMQKNSHEGSGKEDRRKDHRRRIKTPIEE